MLKKFIKYVSQNMLGMVGMSVYILADTYFISVAVGADGITALNLDWKSTRLNSSHSVTSRMPSSA